MSEVSGEFSTFGKITKTEEHKNRRIKIWGGREIEDLIRTIIQCAYNIRIYLAAGFLETVYQKALVLELKEKGIDAQTEVPISVYYKNIVVGECRVDIFVEKKIIIELKAVQHPNSIHEAQLVNYLTATHIDHGLLITFGGERIEIKRIFRAYKPKNDV